MEIQPSSVSNPVPQLPAGCWYKQKDGIVTVGVRKFSATGFYLLFGSFIVFIIGAVAMITGHPTGILFGVFMLISSLRWLWDALAALFGKVEFTIDAGIGSLRESGEVKKTYFALLELSGIYEITERRKHREDTYLVLRLKDKAIGEKKELRFGTTLTPERRHFIVCELHKLIATTQLERGKSGRG